MFKKILVTDLVHEYLLLRFAAEGYEIDYRPDTTDEEVRQLIPNYTGLVVNSKIKVDKAMLDRAVNLTFVARLGSGMEIIDTAYSAEKNIAVYSSPEGNCEAVAEHALGMLLALQHNILRADREVRTFNWQREANRGTELAGKTIAIIGFGHTGSALARKLGGLDMNILAYDKYLPKGYLTAKNVATVTHEKKTNTSIDYQTFVKESNYETIFETADLVSFHLPLSAATRFLVNDSFLARFRKNITLINTSRGNVVETASLIKNLQSGKVLGACLDVFENEKPTTFSERETEQYQKLYSFDNVILTPHIAGWTHESKRRMAEVLCRKILGV